MNRTIRTSAIAVAIATGWALPAHAAPTDAALAQELAAMRAQIAQLAQRVEVLEGELDMAEAKVAAADAKASAAAQAAATPPPPVDPGYAVAWKGAPEISTKGGWSFKPRGRVQLDTAGVNVPGTVAGTSLGVASEFRRIYLGFDGTIPGGFGYRVEADLANSSVELTDVYLTYKAGKELTFTLGQHKPFQSMEDMTSDLFTSFMERAAFNSAFGFERRVGASATYAGKSLLVQGGVFTDNAADLNLDSNNSYSLDGRVVFMPRLGDGQLHIGGSIHLRDFNDAATSTRYRARPFVHTTDVRLINTGNIGATGETSYGAELAYVAGRFHATAESHWITARRPGLADPTFNGGYAEVGYLLTDDATAYKAGTYDRIKPKRPLGKGGIGALQINARYDWLDLRDAGIIGGKQQVAAVSLIWMPTDYVKFLVNYGHLWLDDAAVAAGVTRDYQADSIGLRAQIDF